MKSLVFFFAVFLIIIFAFAVPVAGLLHTPSQVTFVASPDGKQPIAIVRINNNQTDDDFAEWIEIKRLVYWGILRLFGQLDDPSDGK